MLILALSITVQMVGTIFFWRKQLIEFAYITIAALSAIPGVMGVCLFVYDIFQNSYYLQYEKMVNIFLGTTLFLLMVSFLLLVLDKYINYASSVL